MVYPLWTIDIADPLLWLAALTALLLPIASGARAHTWVAAPSPVSYSLASPSPRAGVLDNSYMSFAFVADRYQYLASIGLLLPFAFWWRAL